MTWRTKQRESVIVTEETQQVVDGIMLGDATILIPSTKTSTYMKIAQVKRRGDFLQVISRVLSRSHIQYTFDDYGGSLCLRTYSDPYWLEQRARYYPGGCKVIPTDLRITSLMMLFLYLCDGNYNLRKYTSSWLSLATYGFALPEVNRFAQDVEQVLGVEFKVCLQKQNGKEYPRMYLSEGQIQNLFEHIADPRYIPPSMRYKFPDELFVE